MAASHMWQTRAQSTIILQLYRLYILLMWTWEWLQTVMYACYLWSLSSVCDGRVCDVYFYDLHRHKRTTVLCNSNIFKIIYMMMLKHVLKKDISSMLEVQFEDEHWLSKPNGLYEVIYYKAGKWSKTLRRTYYSGYDFSIIQPRGEILLGMLNAKHTVTNIINEYWTSLNNGNAFTTNEFGGFCLLKMGLPKQDPCKIFIICDDDTLEEKLYEENDVIVLKGA